MARRKRKNIFGFGKQTTHSSRLLTDAFNDGRRTGDTTRAKEFIMHAAKSDKLSTGLKRRLKKEYVRGVESLWDNKYPQTSDRDITTTRGKGKLTAADKGVATDVVDALVGQGMKTTQAKRVVKQKQHAGDSFGELFNRVLKRSNPVLSPDRRYALVMSDVFSNASPATRAALITVAGLAAKLPIPTTTTARRGTR